MIAKICNLEISSDAGHTLPANFNPVCFQINLQQKVIINVTSVKYINEARVPMALNKQ